MLYENEIWPLSGMMSGLLCITTGLDPFLESDEWYHTNRFHTRLFDPWYQSNHKLKSVKILICYTVDVIIKRIKMPLNLIHNYIIIIGHKNQVWNLRVTVCPRSSDPFYIVSYYIKLVTISWTCSMIFHKILWKIIRIH